MAKASIRIVDIVKRFVEKAYSDCEYLGAESNSEQLALWFRRSLSEKGFYQHFLYLFTRRGGNLTTEISLSKSESYPYTLWEDWPKIRLKGIRFGAYDGTIEVKTFTFEDERGLVQVLGESTRQSMKKYRGLFNYAMTTLKEEYTYWLELFVDFIDKEAEYQEADSSDKLLVYQEVTGYQLGTQMMDRLKGDSQFDAFLGPAKASLYKDVVHRAASYFFARTYKEVPDNFMEELANPARRLRILPNEWWDPTELMTGVKSQRHVLKWRSGQDHRANFACLRSLMAAHEFIQNEFDEEELGEKARKVVFQEEQSLEEDERSVDDLMDDIFSSEAFLD